MSVRQQANRSVALTDGLTRNTLFNSIGAAWAMLLAFVTTPYIVHGLAIEGYGIWGVVTLVAGYAGLFSSPMATGSVRFMAQAYAQKEWAVFRAAAIAGVILSGGLALIGSLLIFLAAMPLTQLFNVTAGLAPQAVSAFQFAALGFFFGSIASALESIPAATRRYDTVNRVRIGVSTLRIFAILGAIRLDYGLVGAIVAQVFANLVAALIFLWIARSYLRRRSGGVTVNDDPHDGLQGSFAANHTGGHRHLNTLRESIRRLFSFSLALFLQQIASRISQQVDRTVIGLFLGASSLTFYTVPLQVSDRIPQLISSLTTAFYPLSSEAIGSEKLAELRRLYLYAVRLLVWLSAFLAALIVVGSQDLLLLWVGAEFADKSGFVLATLAVAAVWRTPSTVAFQVYNGLGRADIGIQLAWIYFLVLTAATLLLTPTWGINGTAMAILIATVPIALYADILTQRKLLDQRDWSRSLLPYLKPWAVGCILVLGLWSVPDMGSWPTLLMQGLVIILGFGVGLFLLDRTLLEVLWARAQKYNNIFGGRKLKAHL